MRISLLLAKCRLRSRQNVLTRTVLPDPTGPEITALQRVSGLSIEANLAANLF